MFSEGLLIGNGPFRNKAMPKKKPFQGTLPISLKFSRWTSRASLQVRYAFFTILLWRLRHSSFYYRWPTTLQSGASKEFWAGRQSLKKGTFFGRNDTLNIPLEKIFNKNLIKTKNKYMKKTVFRPQCFLFTWLVFYKHSIWTKKFTLSKLSRERI